MEKQRNKEISFQLHSHIGVNGTLSLEGLHDLADQDVTIILLPSINKETKVAFDLERYRASETGAVIKNKIRAFSNAFAKLPALGDRSPDEIIGYDELGLPS